MNRAAETGADAPPPLLHLADQADDEPPISLRDLLAGLAMAGIWASGRRNTDEQAQPVQIAGIAYATADAMLARRRR